MLTKRNMITGSVCAAAFGGHVSSSFAAPLSLDAFLNNEDSSIYESSRAYREAGEFELIANKGPAPRTRRSDLPLSEESKKLIIRCEATGEKYYNRTKLDRPSLPPAPSGVTIGIGYDLGYSKPEWVAAEWAELPKSVIVRLATACPSKGHSMRGADAQSKKDELHDISVPWDLAERQFRTILVPLWAGETEASLPNVHKLKPGCFGVLVSLVFNRGPSFDADGPQYEQMNNIKTHMRNEAFGKIPQELLDMRWLWNGNNPKKKVVPGLVKRREYEAELFQRSL